MPRNIVTGSLLFSGDYILMPQNCWPWYGPWGVSREAIRRLVLRGASEIAIRRSKGIVRMSYAVPHCGRRTPEPLGNVLDEGFEESLEQSVTLPKTRRTAAAEGALLCVGDICSYRNLTVLLKGYSRYRSAGGRLGLVIAGSDPFRLVSGRLEMLAAQLQSVFFEVYAFPRWQVLAMLRAAAGVVFPSLVEASPVTLLEALALNTNVVASDIPAHREMAGSYLSSTRFFSARSEDAIGEALLGIEMAFPPPTPDAPDLSLGNVRAQLRAEWAWRLVSGLEEMR